MSEIEEVKGFWILKNDNSISVHCREHGTIAYDKSFINLKELNSLPRGSLFIDVGAFIGDITRIALDKGMNAIAFEPQKDAYICLEHNCHEAKNYNIALGDGRKIGLCNSDSGNMGARSVSTQGNINSEILDDYIPQDCDNIFLKLDAEGFEPAILAGATKLLKNPALKYIVCEFNPEALKKFGYTCEDILNYLREWNYREIFRYYDQNWDCIFTRK
jgi:FkbM family methyltransferase